MECKPIVVRFSVENLLDTSLLAGLDNDYSHVSVAPRTYMVSTTFNFDIV